MAHKDWCGKGNCEKCKDSGMCDVNLNLACSPSCEGFIDGTESRNTKFCIKMCNKEQIRIILEDVREKFRNHMEFLVCSHCEKIILKGERYILLEHPESEDLHFCSKEHYFRYLKECVSEHCL